MNKIAVLLIIYLLADSCFGQAIIRQEHLPLKYFENWAELSLHDSLLEEYTFLDSLHFVKIQYLSDSVEIEGFIVTPKYQTNTPVVIFNRGGNRGYFNISDRTLTDWVAPIARHGFSVFASQYRSNDEFGGADVNDVLSLIELAKHYPNIDSTKIGMVGWSRGGLMTYMALTMTSEIDCAIIGGAPTNMEQLIIARPAIDNLLARLIPEYTQNKGKELEKRSPVLWADKLEKTALLLIHGQEDTRVSYTHATRMSDTLKTLNYAHTLLIIESDDHILRANQNLKDHKIVDWLVNNLKAD